ncbi:hypothetical protein IE4872_CH03260 [Rhizobium gallicum]|uniref:Uncharacterized protein n=1 Tax=Rhizobium gallicum TaxID=56730 RepID=A0A1L5NLS4_9HYPH|nr:hypothetical protein IE4872_CH03260 [Rhizobium gallicum]
MASPCVEENVVTRYWFQGSGKSIPRTGIIAEYPARYVFSACFKWRLARSSSALGLEACQAAGRIDHCVESATLAVL